MSRFVSNHGTRVSTDVFIVTDHSTMRSRMRARRQRCLRLRLTTLRRRQVFERR